MSMLKPRSLLLTSAMLLATQSWSCTAASAAPICRQDHGLAAAIDELFSDVSGDRPGYAVGIVIDGCLAVAGGYGLADLKSGERITANTTFNLASLSKHFTATAVAAEIVAGQLTLDDPLSDHWHGLPEFMRNVQIGHLVYMTSGVPEYFSLPSPRGGWASADRFTVEDAISAVFKSGELVFEPGTQWAYNNSNYILLAELVARLNRTTFAEHMENRFFEPLGMENTWVDARLERRRGSSRAYVRGVANVGWREVPRLSSHYGGSGVFSTLNDLARWDVALFRDKVFGRDLAELVVSTRRYAHPKDNDAFGLVHGRRNGIPILWYEGGDEGVTTFVVRAPRPGITVYCLANFANADCRERAYAAIDLAFEERGQDAKS